MDYLIRASRTVASIVLFITLGSGTLAFDPLPFEHRPARRGTQYGATIAFTATAYCQAGVTQSGVDTHRGIAAADPAQLPVGSVVHVDAARRTYSGIYTVLDTGTRVLGRKLDLFMHDCGEAAQFGRQLVRMTVLRKGWSPRATAPKPMVAGVAGE